MKPLRFISVLMMATMLFTGCDFFRSLVGKPTSKDLERMRQEEMARAEAQRKQDSIANAEAMLQKELAEKEARKNILDESEGRYHIIFGSFKEDGNAEKMKARLEQHGYSPKILLFENGFEVVSVKAYDDYGKAYHDMMQVYLEMEICPDDIWIYDINQNLHVK